MFAGIAGYAGCNISNSLQGHLENTEIFGLDNFFRKGSEINISHLNKTGVNLMRGDFYSQSDIDALICGKSRLTAD